MFAALLALLAGPAAAQIQGGTSTATVKNAWVHATSPGQEAASVYFDIVVQLPSVLVAANSTVADRVELHGMSADKGVMTMRQVVRVPLPPHQIVTFAPGGYHVMLIGLKRYLRAGERVPVELILRTRQGIRTTLRVEAEVRAQ